MKKNLVLSLLITVANFSTSAQAGKDSLTSANYEQASKFLGINTGKLVYRNNVTPVWLENGSFWLSKCCGGKAVCFI